MTNPINHSKQYGVAVITVMLVIALMMIMIGFFTERQQLFMKRLTNQLIQEQAYQYAMGIDQWGLRVLNDDIDRAVDYWNEDWAKLGEPEKEEGDEKQEFSLTLSSEEQQEKKVVDFGVDEIDYQIIDLQGRFNLNNLSSDDPKYLQEQRTIFLNLLALIEVGALEDRTTLANNLIDWMDSNDLSRGINSESGDYQSKDTPYYAADQAMVSLGELKFVEGFTVEIINKLTPYVTVLPTDRAKININTTSTPVLSALNQTLAYNTAPVDSFLSQRDNPAFTGFRDIQMAGTRVNQTSPGGNFIRNMMQTYSEYFQIKSRVVLGKLSYCGFSDVLRENIAPNPGSNPSPSVSANAPEFKIIRRSYQIGCDEIIRKS